MSDKIYVAILDSGCRFDTFEKLSITLDENYNCVIQNQKKINFDHGNEIATIINDENINIYDIQIFNENLRTTPIQVYFALKYLVDKKVDVINLSLGLKENYKEIKAICEELIKKGVTIVCSYPRRSKNQIYPAAYNEVIKVTSEWMCKDDKVVGLFPDELFFAANPFSSKKEIAGSSIAVAKFTKEFCTYLKKGYKKEDILSVFGKRFVNEP
jgi:major intracellular serine protease